MPDYVHLTLRFHMEDGWSVKRRANHGLFLTKRFGETVRVTVVKDTTASQIHHLIWTDGVTDCL